MVIFCTFTQKLIELVQVQISEEKKKKKKSIHVLPKLYLLIQLSCHLSLSRVQAYKPCTSNYKHPLEKCMAFLICCYGIEIKVLLLFVGILLQITSQKIYGNFLFPYFQF